MLMPLQLYEVNKTVGLKLQFVDQQQLGQALTQRYYALRRFQVTSIVVCLTDLSVFHYFEMKLRTGEEVHTRQHFSM